jgi:glyoxylase-like metal-dependent hydrolase (beta-lactamase superfamily II)
MARDLIARIRSVSDKPIKYVLLTHYHAVRVLGASAYAAEGATEIIASQGTLDLIIERGKEDMQSEMERFPRLFRGADSVPGLTWPTMVIGGGDAAKGEKPGKLTVDLGGVKVQMWSPGYGHTRGDTIAWVEEEKVLFSGDLVEYEAGVYTGDAQLEEWPATLEALRALNAEFIVPGRGEAMKGNADVNKALDYTKRWVTTLFQAGKEAAAAGMDLKNAMAHTRKSMDPVFGHVFIYEHCLPFDVSRAYDEAKGIKNPRIWTAERDKEMWDALQG